jgi:hypothetical protein
MRGVPHNCAVILTRHQTSENQDGISGQHSRKCIGIHDLSKRRFPMYACCYRGIPSHFLLRRFAHLLNYFSHGGPPLCVREVLRNYAGVSHLTSELGAESVFSSQRSGKCGSAYHHHA